MGEDWGGIRGKEGGEACAGVIGDWVITQMQGGTKGSGERPRGQPHQPHTKGGRVAAALAGTKPAKWAVQGVKAQEKMHSAVLGRSARAELAQPAGLGARPPASVFRCRRWPGLLGLGWVGASWDGCAIRAA